MHRTTLRNGVLALMGLALLPAAIPATALAEEALPRAELTEVASAKATVMDLKYEIYAGGMLGLKVDMEIALTATRYRSSFDAKIAGAFSWFKDFRLRSEVEGLRDGGATQPSYFVSEAFKKGKSKRLVEITYHDDGSLQTSVVPEPDAEDRDDIPEDLRIGTFDPLSAVLMLTEAVALQGSCDAVVPVFDGRRRFDLTAEDLGAEQIDANRYQVYEGEARHCLVKFNRLTGYKEGEMGVKSSYPDNISVYLAPLAPGLPPVPVRMEMDHKFGALRAHLVEADIREEPSVQEALRLQRDD